MMKNVKESNEEIKDAQYYKKKITDTIGKMENPYILKLIYGFSESGYKEEIAGRKQTL